MSTIEYITIALTVITALLFIKNSWKISLIILITGMFPVLFILGGATPLMSYNFFFFSNFHILLPLYFGYIILTHELIRKYSLSKYKTKLTKLLIVLYPITFFSFFL